MYVRTILNLTHLTRIPSHPYVVPVTLIDSNQQAEQYVDGFILCFSMSDRRSFDYIADRIKRIERIKERPRSDIPFVLVGTKADVPDAEKQVSVSDGMFHMTDDNSPSAETFARGLGIPFYEVSSKSGIGVEPAVSHLVKLVIAHYMELALLNPTVDPTPSPIHSSCTVM